MTTTSPTSTSTSRVRARSARAATVARWFGLTSPARGGAADDVAPEPPVDLVRPAPGTITLVTGPSGAGKSSLLRAMRDASNARDPRGLPPAAATQPPPAASPGASPGSMSDSTPGATSGATSGSLSGSTPGSTPPRATGPTAGASPAPANDPRTLDAPPARADGVPTVDGAAAPPRWIDVAGIALADAPVVDCFDAAVPLAVVLTLLGRLGLGEAWTYLRTPSELSDGQRWRLRLALALSTATRPPKSGRSGLGPTPAAPAILVADEFAAVLDRVTAAIVARTVRRMIDAHPTLAAVVATSHDDLAAALRPDVVVRCDFTRRTIQRARPPVER